MGILTPAQLRKNRRYAILVIAIVAALLPGGDPVTMLLIMIPILFLYEGSILLAALLDRRAARARAREEAEAADAELATWTPTTDAFRPQRLRPPPRGQDRVHHARLPDGRRPRAVRDRRWRRAPGGLVDAITEGSGGDSSSDRFAEQEQAATAKARANPTDAALWAAVARARFNLASSGDNIDQNTGNFTDAGAAELRAAGRAWEEHVELAGKNPDSRVASLMVQAYAALGDLDKATQAQEIIAEDRNSAGAYATLATLAYQAGQIRKGDLAKRPGARPHRARHARVLEGAAGDGEGAGAALRDGHADPDEDAEARLGREVTRRYNLGRALVAQLAEQRTLNPKVPGSIPGGGTLPTALS